MAPIRTLHVDTERTWRGGEQQALSLALGLGRLGHPAAIAAQPGGPFAARARAAGLEVHDVAMRGEFDLPAAGRLAATLREGRFDLVHAHTAHAHTLAALAAWRAGVPCVVARRVDFPLRRGPFGLRLLKYRRGVARYLAISEAVRRELEKGGVAPARIRVVPSGIDPARLAGGDPEALRREWGLAPGAPLVGAVGHFAWHKGFEVLIRATPALVGARPDLRVALLGDGEERADLEREARAAPAGAVLFPGRRDDVGVFLRLADVVVAPSHLEGLNTSVLDALWLGRPVVAAAAGGLPEAVIHERTGLLVPPGDPDALAAAVLRLLDDAALARRLGEAGHEHVAARFTAERMVEGTLTAYRELLGRD